MNRKITVPICAVLIVLGILGSYIVTTNAMTQTNNANNGQIGQMPSNNNGTVPNKPGGNTSSNGTPPQPPSGNTTLNGTIPAAPSGNGTQAPSSGGNTPPGSGTSTTGNNTGLALGIIDYILLIICNLVIVASLIFLAMTRLGKLSIKEALETRNKKILFIAAILLTLVLFGATIFIAGQITPTGVTMGASPSDSANIVTAGAYVVDGTKTGNPVTNTIGGFLGIFGIDWYDISETGKTYIGTESDQSAVVVNGSGSLSVDQATVTKNNGTVSSEENSNFYGLNAALLTKTGSKLKVTNTNITTGVDGANAIFATGTNSKVTVENVKIVTKTDSSRGLDATYSGTIIANNIKITTSGAHCAALATDRGGGVVTVTKGVIKTGGEGSPGIYSTGTITATNTKSTATGSEAAVIEGKNNITLTNSNITGYKKDGVMIYQSTSGDAVVGEGIFTMTGGSITAETGPLFYSTNTIATINLENVKLTGNGTLLKASADKWGNSGSNGANITLNAKNQVLNGTIEADNISSLLLNILKNSKLTAPINSNNTAQSVILKLSSDSTWTVTGNSYITGLTDEDSNLSNIEDNGHTIYYNKTNSENNWLNGKTITLKEGGKLTPI